MRKFTIILLALLPLSASAAEPRIERDLAYAEPKTERRTLDIYAPAAGKDHPIVVWIHGGGWQKGDKAGVQQKPTAFVDRGFVFVAINYRFVPQVTVKEMTGDVARAIHWVYDHAAQYGGDPRRMFVMGHSAGAHLAALVCTDDRYLKAEGLSLDIIKGCVPVDVAVYDIPKRIKSVDPVMAGRYQPTFGDDDATHRELSPAMHVATGKHIPPFLILYVASRPETKEQSEWFAQLLRNVDVSAEVVAGEGKTHGTINSDLGLADDKPTQAVYKFLDAQLKK